MKSDKPSKASGSAPKDKPKPAICEQLVISADGAYVPLIKGEWAGVSVAIGEVKKDDAAAGHHQLKTWRHSYFSRMIDATTFEQLAKEKCDGVGSAWPEKRSVR